MIENEGFNWQKNSGMRLEHVYSSDPDKLKVYYLWLQIAHLLLLLMAKGSLLRQLTEEWGEMLPFDWARKRIQRVGILNIHL